MTRLLFGAAGLFVISLLSTTQAAEKDKPTNRLAKESSPYLLQHAHNPVDWYPWGDEAFARRRRKASSSSCPSATAPVTGATSWRRNRSPIEEVAKLMNQWFVCIKVDREERPDVDAHLHDRPQRPRAARRLADVDVPDRRRQADRRRHLLAARGQGDRGREGHGFKTILTKMHEVAEKQPEAIEEQADKIAARTAEVTGAPRSIAAVRSRPRAGRRYRGRPQGRVRSALRRLRLVAQQVQGAQVPDRRRRCSSCSTRASGRSPMNSAAWSRRPSTAWRRAASTITSAAASIATAPNAPGPCRTSRRCSTTTPSSPNSTPSPISRRRSRCTSDGAGDPRLRACAS